MGELGQLHFIDGTNPRVTHGACGTLTNLVIVTTSRRLLDVTVFRCYLRFIPGRALQGGKNPGVLFRGEERLENASWRYCIPFVIGGAGLVVCPRRRRPPLGE